MSKWIQKVIFREKQMIIMGCVMKSSQQISQCVCEFETSEIIIGVEVLISGVNWVEGLQY